MKTQLLTIAAICSLSTAAFAEDPPPPPPPAEDSGPSGGGIRGPGGLLDASNYDSRPMLLSIHATLPYGYFGYGFPIGAGASFYIPIVKNGFIPKLNDEFGIDFGADFIAHLGYTYPISLFIPVSAVWKFHIFEKLEAYAKLGFLAHIWFGNTIPFWPNVNAAVGIHYMISKAFGLKAEVGYPGLRVGIVLAF